MREFVYLFELDSVRKTDEEIIAGQKALYNEIVNNGNIVVLSYNQVVDSRGFFSLLEDEAYQYNLIKLFENGAIRISQYGDIRSLSQYLINSVASEKEFIYSALPLKSTQRRLLALIKRSLQYSDLSEIYDYYTGTNRSEEDLIELFEELKITKEQTGKITKNLSDSSLFHETPLRSRETIIQEMREILRKLYWLLATVLRLSALNKIYIQPKAIEEYKDLQMYNIIKFAIDFKHENNVLWEDAIKIIEGLSAYNGKNKNRSVYLHEIKGKSLKPHGVPVSAFQYAEAIVNLCYNYACELSICNAVKHYDVNELLDNNSDDKSTFRTDFFNRLDQDWHNGYLAKQRYLLDETMYFDDFDLKKALPDFKTAARYTEYISYKTIDQSDNLIYRYEYNFKEKVRNHKKELFVSIAKNLSLAVFCLSIAFFIDLLLDNTKDALPEYIQAFSGEKSISLVPCLNWISIPSLLKQALIWLLFLIIGELVTSGLAHAFPSLSSLSDALGNTGRLIKDALSTLLIKSVSYLNTFREDEKIGEKSNKSVPISLVLSPELKKYIDYQKNTAQLGLFKDSQIYPLADTTDETVKKCLLRLEELYGYKFGVIYQSTYNTLIVDPIKGNEPSYKNSFHPYERVVPSHEKNAVVMIPKYNNSFLLLNQFRHAPRKMQYSFPRGFAEDYLSPIENAIKELNEEMTASILEEPKLLGQVISDSGLTNNLVNIYLVEIESYQKKDEIHEGIQEILEVPMDKMDNWIYKSKIDDGFTLSAYALYQSYIKNKDKQ